VRRRLQPAQQAVDSLRTRRTALERQIASFRAWAFEESVETVDPAAVPGLASVLTPGRPEHEAFSTLRARIQRSTKQKETPCLGLVSATDGEGKTTTALGLALFLAQDRRDRVLLIEADLGAPGVESMLGLPRRRGLTDWLQGSDEPICLRRLAPSGLTVLAAGSQASRPAALLASKRMAQLLNTARQAFDAIMVDSPPVFPDADGVLWLQDHTDGFLFVVRARYTPRATIRASLDHLQADRIHGHIFNDLQEIIPRNLSPRATRPRQRG
jgi:Mrp family chromosome partitioning ATPase